jgi:hypothetical protein
MKQSSRRSPEDQKFARQARWRERNPLARWAHVATASAIRRGILTPEPCRVCGKEPAEAHHPDHRNPLAVEWYCRLHHKAEHQRLKAEAAETGGAS